MYTDGGDGEVDDYQGKRPDFLPAKVEEAEMSCLLAHATRHDAVYTVCTT